MKRLFIGGPADGEWIDVPKDREFWRVAVDSFPKEYRGSKSLMKPMSEKISFQIAKYKKMPFRGNSTTFYVMAMMDMNPDAVIGSLVMGYLKTDVGKSKELLVDPEKLDAESLLDRMAEAS